MSTGIMHPAIEDLAEPLLDVPDRLCEVPVCEPLPAKWSALFNGPCGCGAVGEGEVHLICDPCATWVVADGCAHCQTCLTDVPLIAVEPIR